MICATGFDFKETHFPDGTLCLRLGENAYDYISNRNPYKYALTLHWHYENDSELFTLQCLVDKIRTLNTNIPLRLHMPYIPHARMDRVHLDDCFTLKTFCNVINSMNFQQVYVLNPHSDVAVALLNNCLVIPTAIFDSLGDEIQDKDTIMMYPDAGAAKKFSVLIQKPYVTGLKNRDWETGKITDYQLIIPDGMDIKDKTIIIVDDICSKGYTFLCAARALKQHGAGKILLYVDHCENSVLDGEMINSDEISKIFTTSSIFTKSHDKIIISQII